MIEHDRKKGRARPALQPQQGGRAAPGATPLQRQAASLNASRHVTTLNETSAALNQRATSDLPPALQAGVEHLAGVSLDGVRVERNSSDPARIGAHAVAQGKTIKLAPGQDRHLPHETWHVAQQIQGRVKVNTRFQGGVPGNNDPTLEREADVMGTRAAAWRPREGAPARQQGAPSGIQSASPAQAVFNYGKRPLTKRETVALRVIVEAAIRTRNEGKPKTIAALLESFDASALSDRGADLRRWLGKSRIGLSVPKLMSQVYAQTAANAGAAFQQAGFTEGKITIGNQVYGKTNKFDSGPFKNLQIRMEQSNLSFHGVKSHLRKKAIEGVKYGSEDSFIAAIMEEARAHIVHVTHQKHLQKSGGRRQNRKKSGPRAIPTWTRGLYLSRPGWTPDHKAAVAKGENIRHIIRNSFLKEAVLADYNHSKDYNIRRTAMLKLSEGIVGIGDKDTAFDITKKIYSKLYLHKGNLFAGGGSVNQIIGLAADPLAGCMNGIPDKITKNDVGVVFSRVANIFQQKYNQTKNKQKNKKNTSAQEDKKFFAGLEEFYSNFGKYLSERKSNFEKNLPTHAILTEEVKDISYNFSTDLVVISKKAPAQQKENAKSNMKAILAVNQFLVEYKGGAPGKLNAVLRTFIQTKNVLN